MKIENFDFNTIDFIGRIATHAGEQEGKLVIRCDGFEPITYKKLTPKFRHVVLGNRSAAAIYEDLMRVIFEEACGKRRDLSMPLAIFKNETQEDFMPTENEINSVFGFSLLIDHALADGYLDSLPLQPQITLRSKVNVYQPCYFLKDPQPLAFIRPVAYALTDKCAANPSSRDLSRFVPIPGVNWEIKLEDFFTHSNIPFICGIAESFNVPAPSITELSTALSLSREDGNICVASRNGSEPGRLECSLTALSEMSWSEDDIRCATLTLSGNWSSDSIVKQLIDHPSGRGRKANDALQGLVEQFYEDEVSTNAFIEGRLFGTEIKIIADDDDAPPYVREMNKQFFVTNAGGKTLVFRELEDPALGRKKIDVLSFDDLKKLYSNDQITVGKRKNESEITLDRGEAWLNHKKRRQFLNGVTFAPGKQVGSGIYNLWSGLNVQPKKGHWPLLRTHVERILAKGDPKSAAYILGWIARLFQQPGEVGQVALVFRGKKGTGKTTLSEFLLEIIGQHGMAVSHSSHVTGRFNSHFRDLIFLNVGEAFFSGNKEHEQVLKTLITDKYLTIEQKYLDATTTRNCLHIVMNSNENWVAPCSADERRYAIFDVAEDVAQNRPYFAALRAESAQGGLAAFLYDMLAYDLSEFDVFNVPQTTALTDQKVLSLSSVERWLFDCLTEGSFCGLEWDEDPIEFSKSQAYKYYYCEHSFKIQRDYKPVSYSQWAKTIINLLSSPLIKERRNANAGRQRYWEFAPLDKCRASFVAKCGLTSIDWEKSSVSLAPEIKK